MLQRTARRSSLLGQYNWGRAARTHATATSKDVLAARLTNVLIANRGEIAL